MLQRRKFKRPDFQNCFRRLCRQILYIWNHVSWHLHDVFWLAVHLPWVICTLICVFMWMTNADMQQILLSNSYLLLLLHCIWGWECWFFSLLCALVGNNFDSFTFKSFKLYLPILLVFIIQTRWYSLTLFPDTEIFKVVWRLWNAHRIMKHLLSLSAYLKFINEKKNRERNL